MTSERVTVSELLASLSRALDLVEGQPEGHSLRTAKIAVRIAKALSLDESDQTDAYYASVLKDSGCSNNSARIYYIFGGDDILFKRGSKFIDWTNTAEALKYGVSNTEKGGTIPQKLRRLAKNIAPPKQVMAEVTAARCNRGAMIARSLGFGQNVADAVGQLDEHWNGKGAPLGAKGEDISLLARILCLSQTLEIFATTFGAKAAYEMAESRSGSWFDPAVVDAAKAFAAEEDFWERQSNTTIASTEDIDVPETSAMVSEADVDQICRSYASIIDAKSAFTGAHSTRVTSYAVEIAQDLGIEGEALVTLERAALLHDIGKLGISNQILDKPGKLDENEFNLVKLHPKYTYDILRPITGFARLAEVAASHHERLDGKGYWRGLGQEHLDLDMRCITAADVFDALTAKRPYRDGLPMRDVFKIMEADIGTAFDADCVASLKDRYLHAEALAA